MHLDPKGLEAAELELSDVLKDWHYVMPTDGMDRVIRVYLSASIPADATELAERLTATAPRYSETTGEHLHDVFVNQSAEAASLIQSQAARIAELERAASDALDASSLRRQSSSDVVYADFYDGPTVDELEDGARALLNRRAEG